MMEGISRGILGLTLYTLMDSSFWFDTITLKWSIVYGPHREKTCLWGVCEQQRRRPACASVQSDQCLCYSLIGKYHI